MTRQIFLLVAAAFLIAGCSIFSNKTQVKSDSPPAEPVVVTIPAPSEDVARDDGSRDSVAALARKTHAYTKELQTMLNQREPAPAKHRDAPAQPSDVEWVDFDRINVTPWKEESPHDVKNSSADEHDRALPHDAHPAVPADDVINANQIVSIEKPRPVNDPGPAIVPEGSESTGPAPAPIASADEVERKLALRLRENPRDSEAALAMQLLRLLREQPTPDLTVLAGLPQEDRELISAVIDGMSNFRSTLRADNNLLLSKKIAPVLEMSDRLRAQAELTIPSLALCKRVDGFGVYEPIDPPRFIAGAEHQLILYCEVQNFSSAPNAQKLWETRLTQETVIYTESGLPVWQDKAKTVVDASRNRRHDFFLVRMIKLPANLTIGRYLLKVSVTDEQARRVAEGTMQVTVVAQ